MAAFGVPSEMISDQSKAADGSTFAIWEDNASTMLMFMRLQTQWNVIAGCFLGLNYQSAAFLFKIHNVADEAEMMDDLQAMEIAALQVLNKRKD